MARHRVIEISGVSLGHVSNVLLRVNLKDELFTYDLDDKALAHAELVDGKLLLVTNVKDLTPQDIVARYKSLADIERGEIRNRDRARFTTAYRSASARTP